MILPNLRPFPAMDLGHKIVAWNHSPPYFQKLLTGAAVFAAIALGVYFLYFADFDFDFLEKYKGILLYIAIPGASYLFSRVIAASRERTYILFDRGFIISFGKEEGGRRQGGWAPWHDFQMAELRDDGIRLIPRSSLRRSLFFRCERNRLNVYAVIASQLAANRYIPFDKK